MTWHSLNRKKDHPKELESLERWVDMNGEQKRPEPVEKSKELSLLLGFSEHLHGSPITQFRAKLASLALGTGMFKSSQTGAQGSGELRQL